VKPIKRGRNHQSSSCQCSQGQRLWLTVTHLAEQPPFFAEYLTRPKNDLCYNKRPRKRVIVIWWNWRKRPIPPFMSLVWGSNKREKQPFERVKKVLEMTNWLESQSKRPEGDPIKGASKQTSWFFDLYLP